MMTNLFFNPYLPTMDDYYEPWTYQYDHLFTSPQGVDQPTARPISKVTGKYIDIEAGPNWDDDLGGSSVYARNDINLAGLTEAEQQALFRLEQMVFFYIPRICNHCLNPGCVSVCPSGAIYKRAEDGVVLVSQEKCRGWRFCVSGCPYKKTYYNWQTGKAEKCILCYPRVETGQAPACFHSCVGRIRYAGVLLYDADRIQKIAMAPESELVAAQRSIILNPADPAVIAAARKNGLDDEWLGAAQKSPVYKFVKEWELALPLHAEFRTLPMLFYIPPLLPVVASIDNGNYNLADGEFFGNVESSRIPIKYMARLFSAGNEEIIKSVLRKLWAVRSYQQASRVGNIDESQAAAQLTEAGLTAEVADQISRLTALPRFSDRYVLPPYHREEAIEELTGDIQQHKAQVGFGYSAPPRRGP